MNRYEQLLSAAYLDGLHATQAQYATEQYIATASTSTWSSATIPDFGYYTYVDGAPYATTTDTVSYYFRNGDTKKRKHKSENVEEDGPFEVSEEMRRFIEELEKTKKDGGGT